MYQIEYFTRLNGKTPARDWLNEQENRISAGLIAKFRMIEVEGLNLLKTNVLKRIVGQPDLYEIKYGDYRIITYLDSRIDTFILLNGFRKQRMNERREIRGGIRLKEEYLAFS